MLIQHCISPIKNHMMSEEQNQDSNSCFQSPKLILCLLLWVMSKYFARFWKICRNNHNKISRANGDMVFCGGVMHGWRIMSLCDLEFHHSALLVNTMMVSDSLGCSDHHVLSLCGKNFILREFKEKSLPQRPMTESTGDSFLNIQLWAYIPKLRQMYTLGSVVKGNYHTF